MSGEELLAVARKHMWAAWQLSTEELASQAASTLLGLGMLAPEGGAAELEKLQARVVELEAAAKEIQRLHTDSPMGPCPVCIDGDAMVRGDDYTLPYPCPTARLAGAKDCNPPSQRAAVCRCGEPGVDPYACEADDCTYDFPELNPFGGGPVHGHDAKVSRKCSHCGWHTSVWHVDDGSAEEELHKHTVRVHGSTDGGDAR